jgi:hypothetical protein
MTTQVAHLLLQFQNQHFWNACNATEQEFVRRCHEQYGKRGILDAGYWPLLKKLIALVQSRLDKVAA